MKFVCWGWGFSWKKFWNGGAPGMPIEWQWCLTLYYRSRWACPEEDLEFADPMDWWWCTRSFYFGKRHEDQSEGYEEYARQVDAILWQNRQYARIKQTLGG